VTRLENELSEHRQGTVPTKGLALQNYREKESYLQYEVIIYHTHMHSLLIFFFKLIICLEFFS
jgi:PH and SEC7 domain-containing protein